MAVKGGGAGVGPLRKEETLRGKAELVDFFYVEVEKYRKVAVFSTPYDCKPDCLRPCFPRRFRTRPLRGG